MKKSSIPKFKLDDDLTELMNEASHVQNKKKSIKKKSNAKEMLRIHFDINEKDDEFTYALKNLINESGITNQDLYDIKGQRNAYNMIYSFMKKGQLGIDRIKAWGKVLHKKPVLTFVDMTEEEAKEADKELQSERKRFEEKKNEKGRKK